MDLTKVTRIEVVDHRPPHPSGVIDMHRGSILTIINPDNVWLDLQDGGATLKVFVR